MHRSLFNCICRRSASRVSLASVSQVERLEDRTLLALVSVDGPLGADTETLDEDQGLSFLDITHSR